MTALDVTDPGFDIDAAIDASAAADPSIAGTAGILDDRTEPQITAGHYYSTLARCGHFAVIRTKQLSVEIHSYTI